jgi:hypothetical protein
LQAPAGTNTALAAINDAREAFTAVVTRFTNSPRVGEAKLKMADCYRQLAQKNAGYLANARELYKWLLDPNMTVEPSLRARAKYELGWLCLQEAGTQGRTPSEIARLQSEAQGHFEDLTSGALASLTGGLDSDLLKDAAEQLGLMLEAQGKTEIAANLYDHMAAELPRLRQHWERRRDRLIRRPPAAN